MILRILVILVVLILGSIAAGDLLAVLGHLIPIIIIIAVVLAIGGGITNYWRRF